MFVINFMRMAKFGKSLILMLYRWNHVKFVKSLALSILPRRIDWQIVRDSSTRLLNLIKYISNLGVFTPSSACYIHAPKPLYLEFDRYRVQNGLCHAILHTSPCPKRIYLSQCACSWQAVSRFLGQPIGHFGRHLSAADIGACILFSFAKNTKNENKEARRALYVLVASLLGRMINCCSQAPAPANLGQHLKTPSSMTGPKNRLIANKNLTQIITVYAANDGPSDYRRQAERSCN